MVDNAIVHRIIQDAFDNHSRTSPHRGFPARTLQDRLNFALWWVIRRRNEGQCDENWAAADHYLHARAFVFSGQAVVALMIQAVGYDGVKWMRDAAAAPGNLIDEARNSLSSWESSLNPLTNVSPPVAQVVPGRQRLAEGSCLVSAPSINSLRWTHAGAIDGEEDRQNISVTRHLVAPSAP